MKLREVTRKSPKTPRRLKILHNVKDVEDGIFYELFKIEKNK